VALFEIPLRNDVLNYSYVISLNDTEYTLRYRYNFRDASWYMSIDGYVEGYKLTLQYDLFRFYKYMSGFPQGIFTLLDITEKNTEPSKDNFGVITKLYYDDLT
jgi:hypothetical protein